MCFGFLSAMVSPNVHAVLLPNPTCICKVNAAFLSDHLFVGDESVERKNNLPLKEIEQNSAFALTLEHLVSSASWLVSLDFLGEVKEDLAKLHCCTFLISRTFPMFHLFWKLRCLLYLPCLSWLEGSKRFPPPYSWRFAVTRLVQTRLFLVLRKASQFRRGSNQFYKSTFGRNLRDVFEQYDPLQGYD
jgi:hypothetical protein